MQFKETPRTEQQGKNPLTRSFDQEQNPDPS